MKTEDLQQIAQIEADFLEKNPLLFTPYDAILSALKRYRNLTENERLNTIGRVRAKMADKDLFYENRTLKANLAINMKSRIKLYARLRLCLTFYEALDREFEEYLKVLSEQNKEKKIRIIRQFIDMGLRETKPLRTRGV